MRVPKVFHVGPLPGAAAGSFIVMEHLKFGGAPSQEELGTQLARMHLAQPKVKPAGGTDCCILLLLLLPAAASAAAAAVPAAAADTAPAAAGQCTVRCT